jgi:hypothetical protein
MKKWTIYKHTLTVEGPYKGWSYIGQTCTSLTRRFSNGKGYLQNQRDAAFGKAILQFGWENFEHEILEQNLDSKELADERERFWIFYFNTYIGNPNCKGFNSTKGGDSWGTLGRIKIYKPSTDETIFIRELDLPDYEALGWEKWYTPERKQWLRKKYYEEHRDHEIALNTRNAKARRAAQPKVEPKIKVNLDRSNFSSDEEYYSAYQKEYGRLYRALNKEKLNKQCSDWQKANKERVNENSKKYYKRKKEAITIDD